MTIVMGIETSCDETGIGFVQDGVLLGDALASSMDEILAAINDVVEKADEDARRTGKLPLYTIEEGNKMLTVIQGLDPAGVGARDLRECLLLQL